MSLAKLVLASGTPLCRDPYRKLPATGPSGSPSHLLDDPVEGIGEIGRNALTWMLVHVLSGSGGDVTIQAASAHSLRAAPVGCPILSEAGARVRAVEDGSVRTQALSVLRDLAVEMPHDLADLPRVALSLLDDGSLILEWPLPGRRLGFSICPQASESGWFFVSGPEWGSIMASGALNEAPMEQLVGWALGTKK